jgi:hypothetical protein
MNLKDELKRINEEFIHKLNGIASIRAAGGDWTFDNISLLNHSFVKLLELLEIEAEEKSNE